MKLYQTILIINLILLVQLGIADSPITSTGFSEAYMDIEIVKVAQKKGVLNDVLAIYLSNPDNPVDVKAALINAISWKFEGKNIPNYILIFFMISIKLKIN